MGVKYVFAETNSANLTHIEKNALISDNLNYIHQEWISQFCESVLEADANPIIELIEEIPKRETFLIPFYKNLPNN